MAFPKCDALFLGCDNRLYVVESKLRELWQISYKLMCSCFHRNMLLFDGISQRSQISKLTGIRINKQAFTVLTTPAAPTPLEHNICTRPDIPQCSENRNSHLQHCAGHIQPPLCRVLTAGHAVIPLQGQHTIGNSFDTIVVKVHGCSASCDTSIPKLLFCCSDFTENMLTC